MEDSEIIVSGPEFSGFEYWGSVAEFLVPKMKAHEKDFVFQVDCATGEAITCAEFLRQSLEVAEGLIEVGLEEGDVVLFVCPEKIRSHVTALGILFSGGVLAPCDSNAKPFEFQILLQQFRPKFVICESAKENEISGHLKATLLNPRIILIDSRESNGELFGWEEIRTKVDLDSYVPRKVAHPKESIALICCSSGTTGRAKGVAISHYAILHNLALTEILMLPGKNENFLLTAPLFWVSGILMTINSCYFCQTRWVLHSRAPEVLLEGIEKCKPYFLMIPPHTLLSLVEHPHFKKYDVSSVNIVYSVGSTLGQKLLTKVKDIWNGVAVSNTYGLTETFGAITLPSGFNSTNAVGKLLPGFSVKVVDVDTGKSVGPNQTGECRIKGKRLMNCYYNNEEETKGAFDERGWFCSGDLVYYDNEKTFYFCGRIKEAIQYLNYQILPSELETVLMCVPGVKDVAVVPVPHKKDGNHIRALVVTHRDSNVSAEDIIQTVNENFEYPNHLTAGVQFVDALPRTFVGKLKRAEALQLVDMTPPQKQK